MDEECSTQQTTEDGSIGGDASVAEQPRMVAGETGPDPMRRMGDIDRPYRVAAWLAVVGAMALAGFLVALPAHFYVRGIHRVRRLDVVEVWRMQTNNLPDLGRPALIEALFIGCILVFAVGAAYMIWIAMVDVGRAPRRSLDVDGRTDESEPA